MLSYEVVDGPAHPLVAIARELFKEYELELGVDLCFQNFSEELAEMPGKYGPPNGRLLVVVDDRRPIACGALRPLEPGVCELKRIYIRPENRGLGLGRAITVHLMEQGRILGYETVRLDTLRRLNIAVRMYESLGFTEIPPYCFNPEPDITAFERTL